VTREEPPGQISGRRLGRVRGHCLFVTYSSTGCGERNANQLLSVTPVEPHGKSALLFIRRLCGGLADKPVAFCGRGKAFHLLPQGMLSNFCTSVTLHKSFWNQRPPFTIKILPSDNIYRFCLKVYPPCFWRACPPSLWRACPPMEDLTPNSLALSKHLLEEIKVRIFWSLGLPSIFQTQSILTPAKY